VYLRRTKGHPEAVAPENDAADSSGVGVAGYGVVRVSAVGAKRPGPDVRAVAKPSELVTTVDYSSITEPYPQLRTQRGMQILDPQNSSAVEHGH
jgi:hypothetical protein